MLNRLLVLVLSFTLLLTFTGWVIAQDAVVEAEESPGYVVFVRDYMERNNHRTLPRPEELDQPLTIFASPGEYKPVSFAIRSEHDLEKVRVSLDGDLTGPDGTTISKDRVEIRIAKLMYQWQNATTYKKTEGFLVRNRPMDIPAEYTRRYWLTLHAPYDVVPGDYRATVRITPANDEPQEIPLLVEILPIQLCQPEGMSYFMYFGVGHPIAIPHKFRNTDYLRMIYDDMREHGMTTVTLYAYPGGQGWTDVNRDRNHQMPMAVQMDLMRDSALVADWSAIPWVGAEVYGAATWKHVLEESERRDWPELLFYMVDEPHGDRIPTVIDSMKRLAEFKEQYPEYDFVRTTTAGAENPEVCHYYDVWIAGESISQKNIDRGREMGKDIWTYDCGLGPVDAQSSRYHFGLWCWKSGAKGASNWAYVDLPSMQNRFGVPGSWRDSERDLIEYKNMFSFVYPATDELIPTIGWEANREGIDDYRYLLTLEKTIELAREAGLPLRLIAESQAVIKQIENSIDIDNLGKKRGEATRRVGVGQREFDREPPEEGLTDGGYDRMRYRVAQQIVKLNKALEAAGKSPVTCQPRTEAEHFVPVSRPALPEIPYTPSEPRSMREGLVDSCENFDFYHPTFNQPVWDPPALSFTRVGKITISNDEKIEGEGSIRWYVTYDEIGPRVKADPNYDLAAFHKLHGQDTSDIAKIKIHVKSENGNHPPLNMMLLGTEVSYNKVLLERGEVTDGWKEVVWDISELDMGDSEWGKLMWHIRFWTHPAQFQEGDVLDIYIDNLRMVTKEEPVDVSEPF